MAVQEIEVGKLVLESKLYPRLDVSPVHVANLVDALRAGETFPPVVADDQRYILIDGAHRSKAWTQVYGEEAKIPCELVTADDTGIFRLAVEYNTGHGLSLSPFERTKCLLRFAELGITRDVALRALRMSADKAERVLEAKTAYRALPGGGKQQIAIKGSLRDFRGETLTKKQQEVNDKCGGMRMHYYFAQVIDLVESGLCDRATGKTLDKLYQLRDALNERLSKRKKKSA